MRFLHTADWHLGRPFHGESLLDAQMGAIEHVAEVARAHAVDAILVSGDLYDRALPPVEAVAPGRRRAGSPQRAVPRGRHLRQPRLGDAAGVRLGAPRARGRARAHRPGGDRAPGAARRRVRLRDPVPGARRHARRAGMRGARARAGAGRRDGGRARRPRRPPGGHAVDRDGACVRHGARWAARASATSRSAGRRPSRPRRSRAWTTSRSATCTARSGWATARATRARPCRSRSPRPRHRKSVAVVDLAGAAPRSSWSRSRWPGRSRCCAGRWTSCSPTRRSPARARVGARHGHRSRPPARCDGGACAGASRTRSSLAFDPQGAGAHPEGTYAERLRGLDDTELLSRFVRDVRGSEAEADELALLGDALTAGRVAERLGRLDAAAPPRAVGVPRVPGTGGRRLRRALGEAGLFLLHGRTGAGKTSLLDAVVLRALRRRARRARRAARGCAPTTRGPTIRTEVVLEATLRGRRVRVTRAPEQERPQAPRGRRDRPSATPCSVVRIEDDGTEAVLATRHDEATR